MLITVQIPTMPKPGSHPGPWSPSDIWMILVLPILIVAFMGLVFVRSRRGQSTGNRNPHRLIRNPPEGVDEKR